jgi:hypothetical protein
MSKKAHNLDIHMYSLNDILGLFELSYDITLEDMKRAKRRVIMTHPDKSKLSAEYFIFYKKAYEVVLRFYENSNKQNAKVETTKYEPMKNDTNSSTTRQVKTAIGNMDTKQFQTKFNQLFEENMRDDTQDPAKNEWFSKDEPIYKADEQVSSKNIAQVFDTFKQKNAEMVKYRGVQEMKLQNSGTRLYENDEEDDDIYISSDPFGKLKFDDLRKVHKDQTIFAVSERDLQKVPQFTSVDHMMRERGKQSLTPLEKQEAEYMLAMRDKQYREKIMQKEYNAGLKTMEYAEKNKAVMSSFLHICNGP